MFQVRTLLAVAFLVLSFSVNSVNSAPIPKHDLTTDSVVSEVNREPVLFKRMDPPNSKNNQQISSAHGNQANLQELATSWNYLIYFVENGEKEPLEELILAGAKLNVRDQKGATLLHLAAQHGRFEIMELLRNNGLTLDAVDNYGHTTLHYAAEARENNAEIIRFLVKSGVCVNARGIFGFTPLHLAASNPTSNSKSGDSNVVALLKLGADPNAAIDNDDTPLNMAVKHRFDFKIIDALLDHGADVNLKIGGNESPMEMATKNHMQQFISHFNAKMTENSKA